MDSSFFNSVLVRACAREKGQMTSDLKGHHPPRSVDLGQVALPGYKRVIRA